MITCVETLSRSIFPAHKKTLRLSAARWVACLLLNEMTLGRNLNLARRRYGGRWRRGAATYMHTYYDSLFSFLTWPRRG